MKTSLWFTILAILFSLSLHAQNINKKITDSELNQEILIGYCNRAALQEGAFGEYYLQEYENYDADKEFIEKIIESINIFTTGFFQKSGSVHAFTIR